MKTIKLGIGKELFTETELVEINETRSDPDKAELLNSVIEDRKEQEKDWIERSIFLAIKEKGLIKFETKGNILYGSLKIGL